MATLVIIVEVPTDPTTNDPQEVAEYLLDPCADDPVATLRGAEWADGNRAIETFVSLWTPA